MSKVAIVGISAIIIISIFIGIGVLEKIQQEQSQIIQRESSEAAQELTPTTPEPPKVTTSEPSSTMTTPIQPPPTTKSSKICSGDAGCFNEYVTRIIDGDTIYTNNLKIRLSLTNTPEKNQFGYSEATEFTKELCPVGSKILVDQDDLQRVDKYGRVLAKVFCDDKVLNSELLYNGYANILTKYCSTSEFSGEVWAKKYGC